MEDSSDLAINSVVWAKMKGFTPWPAIIVLPPENIKKQTAGKKSVGSRCVFFFGSQNYAWIEPGNLHIFDGAQKDSFIKAGKGKTFKEAVEQCEQFKQDPSILDGILEKAQSIDTDAEFDRIRNEPNISARNSMEHIEQHDEKNDEQSPLNSSSSTKLSAKRKRQSSGNSGAGSATKTSARAGTRKRSKVMKEANNTDSSTPSTSKQTRKTMAHEETNSSGGQQPYGGVAGRYLLNRPLLTKHEDPIIDMKPNEMIISRGIEPTAKRIGFLGLGIMGSVIVKNFLTSGHKVNIWNRTRDKCHLFEELGAVVKDTPSDVCEDSDIIFSCVTGPKECRDLVFGNCGILINNYLGNKSYVEMSTIDPESSNTIANGIRERGGKYLEAQIQGSKSEAESGTLVIIAGGDRSVFDECQSCFKSISKNTFFLGEAGNAAKVNLIIQTLAGITLAGLSECLALADRFSILQSDIMDIISLTGMRSNMLLAKSEMMQEGKFPPEHRISLMQKDLKMALEMADSVDQSMPQTAAANEVFKQTKRLGYTDHDSSAVYLRTRF